MATLKNKELEAKSLQGDIKVLETKLESESKASSSLERELQSLKEETKAYKKSIFEKDEYIKELNKCSYKQRLWSCRV
jgi:hypothetical protein